jgi:hypothetical protein
MEIVMDDLQRECFTYYEAESIKMVMQVTGASSIVSSCDYDPETGDSWMIHIGLDSANDLCSLSDEFLSLSERWGRSIFYGIGHEHDDEYEFYSTIRVFDLTAMIYQGYEEGEYDTGFLAGTPDISEWEREAAESEVSRVRNGLETREDKKFKDWINS